MSTEPLLTPKEVAEILQIREKDVHLYARQGILPSFHISARKIRFSDEHVWEFLKSRESRKRPSIDKEAPRPLRSTEKGGDSRKSVEDSGTDLGKEIRGLCR